MKQTNEIAKQVLREEFSDYKKNQWHYRREYKLIVKALRLQEILNGNTEKRENELSCTCNHLAIKLYGEKCKSCGGIIIEQDDS